jgi:hypothetical protein
MDQISAADPILEEKAPWRMIASPVRFEDTPELFDFGRIGDEFVGAGDDRVRAHTDRVLFVCQVVLRVLPGVLGVVRRDFVLVVVALARVREWPGRRAGVSGCEPAALATESFPGCPPEPVLGTDAAVVATGRRASATMVAQRVSLMRRLRARSASFGVLPWAILRS